MSPIGNALTRSLCLTLIVFLGACGSDDDDAMDVADPGVEIGSTSGDGSDAEVPPADDPDEAGSDVDPDGDETDAATSDDGAADGGTDGGATDAGTDDEATDAGTDDGATDAGTDDGATDAGAGDAGPDDTGAEDGEPGQGQPSESPDARPAVSVFPFDPADGTPVIDGSFDEAWTAATFSDESGENLLIDRLLIDRGAEAADGGVPYVWFAMHDFESLYLFVQFERAEPYTPFGDSERFFDDDALNLFFDGDASRGERLEGRDGGDDRYVAIPLLAREGETRPEAFAPLAELAPEVPPSLEYGVCVCEGSAMGWELRIALSDLNIEVGRPFGFEVQLDQDLDGGGRDARWGWSNPAPAMGGVFVPESPALSGTVTLREEPRP